MPIFKRNQPRVFTGHWKPQNPSQPQNHGFAGPVPCASVRLDKSGVSNYTTRAPILSITREAVHLPSFLSSKPLLSITRSDTKTAVGTIRFHKLSTTNIQLNINGCDTTLTSSRRHRHWMFQPTSVSDAKGKRASWYWKRDKLLTRSVILVDAKKTGSTIARIDGNILIFEKAGLSDGTLDEIIMTAIALSEHARRRSRNSDIVDLSQSIGDLAGSYQGGHQGGHHGGHHGSSHHAGSSGGGFFGGGDGGGGGHGGGDGGGGGGGGCGGGDGGGGGGGGGC